MENTVTLEGIQGLIKKLEYHHQNNKTTVCFITLKNGFEVIGTSRIVDNTRFDRKVGEEYAYKDAIDKLRAFEGYLLQWKLWKDKMDKQAADFAVQSAKGEKTFFQMIEEAKEKLTHVDWMQANEDFLEMRASSPYYEKPKHLPEWNDQDKD